MSRQLQSRLDPLLKSHELQAQQFNLALRSGHEGFGGDMKAMGKSGGHQRKKFCDLHTAKCTNLKDRA